MVAAPMILPVPDRDSAPYWSALAHGRVEIQHCLDCGSWTWPPRPICSKCHNENFHWEGISGTGEVHSWVVAHRAVFPHLKDLVPYTIALVRLDEQDDILIPGRLLSHDAVHQGTRVRAVAERLTDTVGELLWEIDPAGLPGT
jgi:uncharacterized OB-fold protein